jgi:hypothetical protein
MVGMPYYYEIGPTFEVLEDVLNNGDPPTAPPPIHAGDDRAIHVLNELRNPAVAIATIIGLDSVTLNAGPNSTKQARIDAANRDWFGRTKDATGAWVVPQAPFDPENPATTGRWVNWYGQAEEIVRTTLQRALEVALGLEPDHTIAMGTRPPRHWPIAMIWKCGQPWFEGWITWRRHGACGQVLVVFSTPGNGDPISTSPLAPPNRAVAEYGEYPAQTLGASPISSAGDRGHWVVAQQHQERPQEWVPSSAPRPRGGLAPTIGTGPMLTVSNGDVVTVAPSEIDGGVLAHGRPYQR